MTESNTHLLTHRNKYEDPETNFPASQFTLNRYGIDTFHGIMPDTGAAKVCSAREAQFHALMKEDPKTYFDINTADRPG
ncbi:hypothetical protein GcM1_190021 [Golovinomyces cichoracearum]|uniref:Uncharacterized protein n=1 Tax=Golovinomyces cichoracearum TaxID=62708 RepID=A0A420J1Q1_9PEZI|nr:hypothetical protein GcM1_190021 [Golovinomyces cichoracearum]